MPFPEPSFEDHILGGSAEDAVQSIRKLSNDEQLVSLHVYERNHMSRKTVIRAINQRINHIHRKASAA